MTSTDKIEDYRARCLPHMLRLRLIARDENGGMALTWQAVTLLSMRLSRLTAAANDAIAAAGDGDSGQLRRYLHRFEVLTSAIWTVQLAVSGPGSGRR